MFRKPKSKNIRQRIKDDHDDEDVKVDEKPESSNLKEVNIESTRTVKTKSLLSFDQDEGNDVTEFKLKKNTQKSVERALLKKHKKLVKEYDDRKAEIKKEVIEQDEIVILKNIVKPEPKRDIDDEDRPRFKVPEKMQEIDEIKLQEEVREKFSSTYANIPDAQAVYEARKKREKLRRDIDSGFIPVDDTVRVKNSKGERARLVREDENDYSDDDQEEGGKFYSKSLLMADEERRRAEQEEFLRIEQGDDSDLDNDATKSDDDDELARWEREQIRKGVSYQKVVQLQNEYNLTSMHNRGYPYLGSSNGHESYSSEPQPMDMDVEIIDEPTKHSFAQNLPTSSAAVSMENVLSKLSSRINIHQEQLNSKEEDLKKLTTNLSENRISIAGMESAYPNLQERFQMFQEMRIYTRNLLECLNEKIETINLTEDEIMKMWKSRSERLIKRRRQDVQDQYERCAAASAGRQWKPPSDEYGMRESEREARRSRRKIQREKSGANVPHNAGLSSDDEEPISQTISYKEKIANSQEVTSSIFNDASEDYADISNILSRFINWISIDSNSFDDAYISLCMPKLLSPFIRLQLLDWDPLKRPVEESALQNMEWYKQVLRTSSILKCTHPAIVDLIPTIVEKLITPLLAKIVSEQWDPLSFKQSTNLSNLIRLWIDEYPTMSGKSKQVLGLLEAIRKKAKASIDDDTFVPLYSKEAIENSSSGCGVFVDRQFWTAIKLMRSFSCFRTILSDSCLEELIMEGIVNRSVVLSLQFSVLSDPQIIPKCRAVLQVIHSSWLPPSNPTSYRSLAAILDQIANEHKQNREFTKELKRFIELVRDEKDNL